MIALVGPLLALAFACALWVVAADAARRRSLTLGDAPSLTFVAALCAGATPAGPPVALAASGALVAGTVDARTGAIPDPLTTTIAFVALIAALVTGETNVALAGAAAGGGALGVLYLVTRGRGIGLGDVKLAAAIGLGYGPLASTYALGVAFVAGGAYGAWLLLTRRAQRGSTIRFGPFLAGGALVAALLPLGSS